METLNVERATLLLQQETMTSELKHYLSSGMIHHHSTHPDAAAILLSSKLNFLQEGNQNYNQNLYYIVTFIRSVFISFITFLTPL